MSDGYHVGEPLYNELIGEYPTEDTEPGAATSEKESGAATPVTNVGNLEYKMNIDMIMKPQHQWTRTSV
jgi:hypothetical protein